MRNRKTTVDVVRAWKDPAYRATLSGDELARIPASPVGMSELDPNVLGTVVGGQRPGRKQRKWERDNTKRGRKCTKSCPAFGCN